MRTKSRYSLLVTRCSFLFLLIISLGGLVYAEENLEELRNTLLEQERQASAQQKQEKSPQKFVPSKDIESGEGNRGLIYSSGISGVSGGHPAYIQPGAETQISELYKEARILFGEGRFDEARLKLEEIVKLNPLHIPAKRLTKMIVDKQNELTFQDNMIEAKESMIEADKKWFSPTKREGKEEGAEEKRLAKTPQQKIMEEKASQIIPEINFTDAHIRDVLKYLSDISGINIVLDEDIFPKMTAPEKVPGEVSVTKDAEAMAEVSMPQGIVSDRITISLTNIPLIEALKYILSAKGLKYRMDEYAIVISTPEKLSSVEMVTRYYYLSAGVGIFTEFVKKVKEEGEEAGKIERGLKEEAKITIKDVLEESGVPFPSGSKVLLDKRTGTLIVRNTPQNLQLVEEVLKMLDITPFQVEIEARFIEITQGTAQELGLEWMITSSDYRFGNNNQFRWDNSTADVLYGQYPSPLGEFGKEGVTRGLRYLDEPFLTDAPYQKRPSGNIISISGILTKPEFRMILHALNQSGFTNVLSAPKVTTLNNQQAEIEVVKEIIYPTEYELTPATTNDAGTVVTQPVVTPAAFTTRYVGIILNVTPSVGADKKTINLNLKPEVSKFLQWDDFGITKGENWNDIPIKQPRFFKQDVETNVVVHDGETVVLGGLVKEELETKEDKIPLLGDIPFIGRLFRTNSESNKRTNLLIFVTANLLTPTGERISKE